MTSRGRLSPGRLVLLVTVAAIATVCTRLFILVDVLHAVAVGCALLALGLLAPLQHPAGPAGPLAEPLTPKPGRADVDGLALPMLERETAVRKVVIDRVRAQADARLARDGLRLDRQHDADAVEALLGSPAWSVLRPDRTLPVTPLALGEALSALERLDAPSDVDFTEPRRTAHVD